ncbi:MAG: efflux RND transporter periplasmic adaptor subunit [Muribaculaceae bacterium]|nr:efflux RND transporter periplasmic adaptor subunit [Muribaculaceae bacterium]
MKFTAFRAAMAVVWALSGAAALPGCGNKAAETAATDYELTGDTVVVNPASSLASRISCAAVEINNYTPRFSAPAEVRAVPARYAEVGVPFAGRIAASLVVPGQQVAAGTPLFRISSTDFMELCRDALDARSEKEQAARALARTERMHATGMSSDRELEEARAEADMKARAAAEAAASLRVMGVDVNSVVPGEPLVVRAPIAGTVMKNTLVTGQYVKDDTEAAIVVADLERVWAVANVKEHDFALLRRGIDAVGIVTDAMPDTVLPGRVYHINDILDPATRSAEVIIELDNAAGLLKPNMFATASFTGAASYEMQIPAEAIRRRDDKAYVMRLAAPGRYLPVAVEVAEDAAGNVIVRSGLRPGDSIVARGAFYLPEAKNI